MKLIAQSQIPTSPLPYLHLGYVSAAGWEETNFGCVLMLGVWIIGLLYLREWRRKSRWVLPGVICAILLATGVGVYKIAEGTTIHELAITRLVRQMMIQDNVEYHWRDSGTYPHNIIELQQQLGNQYGYVFDSWDHLMRYTCTPHDGNVDFTVQSAGRDGCFDTNDDITRTWTCTPKDREQP